MWKEKPGAFRQGGLTSWGCIIRCSPNREWLEAWLALMLYLCSKVACFPYTFKDLPKGESTSMYV